MKHNSKLEQPQNFDQKKKTNQHQDFFEFNIADKDHEKIWDKEKELHPEALLEELAESDEY